MGSLAAAAELSPDNRLMTTGVIRKRGPMVYSEKVQFCLANASRNERMASRVSELGLKASYTESANHWRRLAEQIKQLEKGGADQPERSIADMARDLYPKPGDSILEARGTEVSQLAQSREDNAKPDNAADDQEQNVLRHSLEHPDADQNKDVQNLGGRRDDAESQETQASHNSVEQIDARRDPLTGQWECLLS
jgi:hypothetical protein